MDIQQLLTKLIAGEEMEQPATVNRHSQLGTPSLWEETIELTQPGKQRYSRLRSSADEGGAPIGRWHGETDAEAVKEIAKIMLGLQLWTLQSDSVEPGEEITTWSVKCGDFNFELSACAGSQLIQKLAPLDLSFRRVANTLVDAHNGIALYCELNMDNGQVSLVNKGREDAIIANPLMVPFNDTDYLRVEVAPPVQEQPGVTSLGLEYQPIALQVPRKLPDPFSNEFLQVRAGDRLDFPVTAGVAKFKRHFTRAVFSNYIDLPMDDSQPLIRGRVFSEELQIG